MKITFFNDWRLGVLKGADRIVDVSALASRIAPTEPDRKSTRLNSSH